MENFRVQLHKHITYLVEIEAEPVEDAMETAESDPEGFISDGSAWATGEWVDVEEEN